ncbi:hypothetical protein BDV93DRAFT_515485 [Ceratobasidium sp. AG-I]|nr:hypothetical protein BDV93DRAFT_515485 [Ceratobasidium sp. AG-I]
MPSASTKFTRRPKSNSNWRITQTNGVVSLLNNWHKNEFNQRDVEYVCTSDPNRKGHEPEWEAVPKIFGESHPQYTGCGTSKAAAQKASAQKIYESGHCCNLRISVPPEAVVVPREFRVNATVPDLVAVNTP